MAKADGQVRPAEVAAFRRVFQIAPQDEAAAARVFNLARQDIAGYLGLAPETLSRTLADFERLELITLAPQGLSILNRKKLMAAADGYAATPRRSTFDAMARADDNCSRSIRRRS